MTSDPLLLLLVMLLFNANAATPKGPKPLPDTLQLTQWRQSQKHTSAAIERYAETPSARSRISKLSDTRRRRVRDRDVVCDTRGRGTMALPLTFRILYYFEFFLLVILIVKHVVVGFFTVRDIKMN